MKQKLFSHRKILALLLVMFASQWVSGQNFEMLPNTGNITNSGSTPQGHQRWTRTAFVVTSAELAATGMSAGQVLTYMKLSQQAAATVGASGTLKVYMENTSDATYLKSATWATLLTGMTTVVNTPFTHPTVTGMYTVNLSTPFTYTGQSLYIAIEYSNPLGALSTTTAHWVNVAPLTNLAVRGQNTLNTAPAVLAATASRPEIQMGAPITNDITVKHIYTLGKLPIQYGAPTVIRALITNLGTAAMNSINVECNISGSNSFIDNVPILTLAAGASTVVTFASYSPSALGTGDIVTVTATAPGDLFTWNDTKTWSQDVTPNVYSYKNPAQGNGGGVGFNGGTGDFVAKFNSNAGITPPYTNPPEINEIKVDLTTAGQTYRLGIWDANGVGGLPGANLWTSPNLVSAIGTSFIPVPNISVNGNYYVGVRQINTTNVGFAYQSENPIRTGTFYYASPTGATNWTDFAPGSPFRFSIEVQVRIPVPPNCAMGFSPVNGSSLTCDNPTLSWQGGGGAPTGYDVYFSTDLADVTNLAPAALVSSNQAGLTYNPGSLSQFSTYYWTIIPRNADGPASGCPVQSFTTGGLSLCYCIPQYTGLICAGGISQVTFNTISNAASCAPPAHAVYAPIGALTTSVEQNGVYNLSVTTTDADIISVWIDYNQDGSLDNTEWTQVTLSSVANTPSSVAINIPGTALLGNTLMRIRSRFAGSQNLGTDACTQFGSGSSQDYIITVIPPVPCTGTPAPGNTIASAATVCSGGTINFSLQFQTPGIGVTYQWHNLSGPVSGANSNTYSQVITGYDEIRCDVTCAGSTGSSVEAIVDVSSFYTCYCAAGATTGCGAGDEYIGNVTFNTINNSSACGNTYTDYTSITTAVTQAVTYTASVLIPNYFAGDQASIWIDFDHNGIFNTTDEQFILNGTGASAVVPFTTTIQIPITALTGLTGMRVRGTFAGVMSPCGDAAYGEVEDYLIDILVAPPCVGTPTPGATLATASSLCGSGLVTFSLAGQATLLGTGISYQWMNNGGAISGATNQTYTTTVSATDQYSCVVSCSGSSASSLPAASVTVNPLPTVAATSSAPMLCIGSPAVVLTATGSPATYSWLPAAGLSPATGSPVSASPASSTNYTVTATDGNGCTATSSVSLQVHQPPTVSTIPSATSACPGDSIQFTTTATAATNGSLLTTLLAGNGSSGNAFDIIAANTVTVTGFKMHITAGTTAEVWYKAGSYGNANLTSSTGWTQLGTAVAITPAGPGVLTNIPVTASITIPAGQTYGFVVVCDGTNSYTNGTTVGSIYSSNSDMAITEGHGGGGMAGVFNFTFSPRVWNGEVTYTKAGTPITNYAWTPAGNMSNATIANPKAAAAVTTTYQVTVTDANGCTATDAEMIIANICNTTLNLTCLIEGYWDGVGGLIGVLAMQSEPSAATACDSIDVELRDMNTPYGVMHSLRTLLHQDGTATCVFPALSGSYYIAVKNRTSVQTWSAMPVAFAGPTVSYNFTTAESQAYGAGSLPTAMKEVATGVWAFYSGDIISDENVDLLDLGLMETDISDFAFGYEYDVLNINYPGVIPTDINGDGNVDLLDSPILENNISNFIFSIHPL